jgi:hypothetical protein
VKQEPREEIDLNKIFARFNSRQVGVENMQAKIVKRKVSLSFELNNLQASKSMAGQATISIVKKDGTAVSAKINKSDLAFQIQRFKRMQTSFILPDGLDAKNLFGLRLQIKGKDGDVVFAETYSFYSILS